MNDSYTQVLDKYNSTSIATLRHLLSTIFVVLSTLFPLPSNVIGRDSCSRIEKLAPSVSVSRHFNQSVSFLLFWNKSISFVANCPFFKPKIISIPEGDTATITEACQSKSQWSFSFIPQRNLDKCHGEQAPRIIMNTIFIKLAIFQLPN